MWASSWVKFLTLINPWRAPENSCLWTIPNSPALIGKSLYECIPCLYTKTPPGQFIGFIANSVSSISDVYIFSL